MSILETITGCLKAGQARPTPGSNTGKTSIQVHAAVRPIRNIVVLNVFCQATACSTMAVAVLQAMLAVDVQTAANAVKISLLWRHTA